MIVAVIITLLASIMWSFGAHIDKYLICKMDNSKSSIKSLMLFSTFVIGIISVPIWLIITKLQVSITLISLIFITLAVVVYVLSLYFYFKAMEMVEASNIIVMFQVVPVFSYIFALIFFKEQLSINQIVGGLIIILSAMIISFDFSEKSKSKIVALGLVVLSSILTALYYICFEVAMNNSSYMSVTFWYEVVLLFVGLLILLKKDYRDEFINMVKINGKKFISLNVVNEGINLIAQFMVNFANLTLPIAIANVLNGFQGAFTFIIGVIGGAIFPKIFSEDVSKKIVIQKVSCIILGILGMIVTFYK